MKFSWYRAAMFGCGAALAFICSCEKHQVGEYPEVQRDRLYEAQRHLRENQPAASPRATPVDFFPEQNTH